MDTKERLSKIKRELEILYLKRVFSDNIYILNGCDEFSGYRVFTFFPTDITNETCILRGVSPEGDHFRLMWHKNDDRGYMRLWHNEARVTDDHAIKLLRQWCCDNIPYLDVLPHYPDKPKISSDIAELKREQKILESNLVKTKTDEALDRKIQRYNDLSVELGESFGKYSNYRIEPTIEHRYKVGMHSMFDFSGSVDICRAYSPEGYLIELFYAIPKDPKSLSLKINDKQYSLCTSVPPNARVFAKKFVAFVASSYPFLKDDLTNSGFKW
jgi:hypothetical protein